MIKEMIDFKEMTVKMLLLIAVYLAIDASLGSALSNSTSFILLKTIVGFSVIVLVVR